ncbi:MAG: hypothetical protein KGH57_00620 [Candidatus Micrarchaeota archaeon]|nr:hypothetical protein [Candidatus Micrarchaeota archaeon]
MKSGAALLTLLALLIFASQARAQATISCLNVASNPLTSSQLTLPTNLIGFSLLGLIISIDVVAIGYIIGRIIPSSGIRNWISEEFLEIAKTAMLIVGIFAVLTLMGNVASLLTLQPTGTSYQSSISSLVSSACGYLNTVIGNQAVSSSSSTGPIYGLPAALDYMLGLAYSLGGLNSIKVGFFLPIPIPIPPDVWLEFGYVNQPYVNTMLESTPTTGSYESMLNDMFTFLLFPISMLLIAQQALLPMIVILGLAVLIPVGIAMRSFPFIRGVGGTLVAIGIGMAVIYPATLALLNGPVTDAFSFGTYSSSASVSCGSSPFLCTLFGTLFAANSDSAYHQGVNDGITGYDPYTIFNIMNGMLFYTFVVILQFLLFIADIAIAYPLTDSIARTLGGTITLQLGGKLKLV